MMEHSLTVDTKGGDIAWSDKSNMSSDGGSWDDTTLPSPSPTESVWKGHPVTPPPTRLQTGQLSPVSSSNDANMDHSSASAIIHSASSSSSCRERWGMGYSERDDDMEDDSQWDQWEQGSSEVLVIPKLEPMDDEINLSDVQAAPLTPVVMNEAAPGASSIKQKRPRGRPRKHPLAVAASTTKVTKGRSKTGCITCRKRKKKCDEAKPRCMNCEKNAVVCEGYHERQVWKSGKERAEEERLRWENLPVITMQPIFHGVETTEDKIFWKHYINHFSNVLTVEGEAKNAFKDIILQLANQHQGLMHSILAVSSKHIDLEAPYGLKILQDNPSTSQEALHQRGEYHHDEALRWLYEDMSKPMDKDDPEYKTVLAARYGQMLCLLLQTRAEGNPRGEHRVHLQAYRNLIQHNPPDDPTLLAFITEYFQYHVYADDLFWHPETMSNRLASEDWEPPVAIHPPRLMGVADGLFRHLSQIAVIRNTIRANMAAATDPVVDYTSLYKASEIDSAIREWTPRWPPGDSRGRLGLLYKQMMWVYLFRTIYPPSPAPASRSSREPLLPTRSLSACDAPRRQPGSMAGASSGPQRRTSLPGASDAIACCTMTQEPSKQSHEGPRTECALHAPSSPPVRRLGSDDDRITLAVDESLEILGSFSPSEPAQTLLLIPCLILGTACFRAAQQQRIRAAVKAVRGYTGLRNCDRVLELLEEVWRLMAQGDWVAVWDWQGVARRMGLNFPCA